MGARLLRAHEVACRERVGIATVRHWIRTGRLPAYRTPGGHYRIHEDDLVLLRRPGRDAAGAAERPITP